MFGLTAANKYSAALRDDVAKLVPKFSNIYKGMEKIVISSENDQAKCLACAMKYDKLVESYTEVSEWYGKMIKPASKRKAAKGN
eukprot:7368138-Pyramimonas_sp.AAC.1